MLEHTKKHPIDVFLSFVGPHEMKDKAIELMLSIGFSDNQGGIPWRTAFPEFSGNEKGTVLKGSRLREGLTQKQLSEKNRNSAETYQRNGNRKATSRQETG